jgi:hypothetical protein
VSYTYDAAHLRQAGAACLPAGPAEADWLLRSDGLDLTVETGDGSASIPYLGQLVAAAQATLGVVPCGG